jgi:hypothetical protein
MSKALYPELLHPNEQLQHPHDNRDNSYDCGQGKDRTDYHGTHNQSDSELMQFSKIKCLRSSGFNLTDAAVQHAAVHHAAACGLEEIS